MAGLDQCSSGRLGGDVGISVNEKKIKMHWKIDHYSLGDIEIQFSSVRVVVHFRIKNSFLGASLMNFNKDELIKMFPLKFTQQSNSIKLNYF